MTAPLADCPPDDLLAKYLDDVLSPTVTGPLTAHIDGCPTCQIKLDTITAGGAVSDRLKELSTMGERSPEATLERGVTTATDTQVFGSDGIPMVPRIHVPRPTVPGYDVEAEIGRGGMGVVFKAQHKRLNRTMALKMVLAAGVADPRVTQRFLFEAEVLARVQHPQVVQVYEVNMFTAPTGVVFPYLAMELLPGGTLLQWANGRPLAAAEAAALIEGLARAVHAVHQQGIIHRDLKPANVLRSADGVFKVSDFGLAKLTAEPGAQLTGTGMVVGTPAYMAPEQAGGGGVIGPPADVYSLGAMLFELLAGRPPFPGDDAMSVLLKVIRDPAPDVRSLRGDVPRDLAAVVMKCLTKEPARRYPSADDLADDLRRFLNHRPTRARTLSSVERGWYWARRNPSMAGLLGTLAAVLTVGLLVTLILWQRAEGTAEEMRRAKGTAERLRKRAEEKSDEAEGERRKADRTTAYVLFDQAWTQCEAGYVDDGLAGFVKALELAERLDDKKLARVTRVNIAAWEREQYPAGRRVRTEHPFVAADFSPDGKRMIAADGDGLVRVYDAATATELASFDTAPYLLRAAVTASRRTTGRLLVSPSKVTGVALDRTGWWAAACTLSGRVVVWSLADRKEGPTFELRSPHARSPATWRVAFTADGRLWVGADDGLLFAFNPATGQQVAAITLPDTPHPNALASALGGTSFLHATARPDRTPEEEVDEEGEDAPARPTPIFQYPKTSVIALRPSPDGTRLFAGDRRGRVTEWDPTTGRLVATYPFSSRAPWVSGVAVSADGEYVAATGTDGTARLWRRSASGTATEVWRIDLGGAYGVGVALSADAGRLAVGDGDGRVVVYDTRTRGPIGPTLGRAAHNFLAIRPDGGELLLNEAGELRLVKIPDAAYVPVPFLPPATIPGPRVRFLDYRPDGKALLVGVGGLWVFDPATGRMATTARPPVMEEPIGGRFSEDGTHIVYGGRHEWGVLSATDFTRRFRFPLDSAYISNIPARPTAAGVLVRVRFALFAHRMDTGEQVRMVTPRGLSEYAEQGRLVATPDGREWRMSTAETIEFVNPTTGDSTRPAVRPGGTITTFDQSADGRHLLIQVGENAMQVWDAAGATRLHTVRVRHRGAVTAVALSPDATAFLTGSRDRTAQFWDAETGLVLGPRRVHTDSVSAAIYSPDGREVAVGTTGGMTLVWQVPPPPTTATLEELQKKYAGQ